MAKLNKANGVLKYKLYEWFMIKRSEGASTSEPMLIEKAKELQKWSFRRSVPFPMVG
jgi:hypothetical protein